MSWGDSSCRNMRAFPWLSPIVVSTQKILRIHNRPNECVCNVHHSCVASNRWMIVQLGLALRSFGRLFVRVFSLPPLLTMQLKIYLFINSIKVVFACISTLWPTLNLNEICETRCEYCASLGWNTEIDRECEQEKPCRKLLITRF